MGDVTFTGPGILIITGLMGALSAAVIALWKLSNTLQADKYAAVIAAKDAAFLTVIATKDQAQIDLKADRDNYRRMATQAILAMEAKVNSERERQGMPAFDPLAAVRPEHNSPPSEQQRQDAEFAEMRARVTAAALELQVEVPEVELPPLPEPPSIDHAAVLGVLGVPNYTPLPSPAPDTVVTLHPGESMTIQAEPGSEAPKEA